MISHRISRLTRVADFTAGREFCVHVSHPAPKNFLLYRCIIYLTFVECNIKFRENRYEMKKPKTRLTAQTMCFFSITHPWDRLVFLWTLADVSISGVFISQQRSPSLRALYSFLVLPDIADFSFFILPWVPHSGSRLRRCPG